MATIRNPSPASSIDPKLNQLEQVRARINEVRQEEASVIAEIRTGLVDTTVVFIDMADSTQFKVLNANEPEKWILRVRQFTEVVSEYMKVCGGTVVKFIGDEVMGLFTGKAAVSDAVSLILRARDIEADLASVTGVETRIKITVDKGPVYLLKYEGHDALDPIGTPVDRCARIAKHAKPGTTLSSHEFVKDCPPAVSWVDVGRVEMKGLGETAVYQLAPKTISVVKTVEIEAAKHSALESNLTEAKKTIERLELEQKEVTQKNLNLQAAFKKLGKKAPEKDSVTAEESSAAAEEVWVEIEHAMVDLKKLVDGAPVPSNEYARFLFLDAKNAGQKYNKYERTFDACIEANLVTDDDGFWTINEEHRLNKKARQVMKRLQSLLETYETEYRDPDDDDQYDYSLSDPSFWSERLGYTVG
jgi:class 3 adenylate cyclase